MKKTLRPMLIAAFAAAISTAVIGCAKTITGANAAPGMTPANNRQAMIEWHRQHDKNPAKPPTGN